MLTCIDSCLFTSGGVFNWTLIYIISGTQELWYGCGMSNNHIRTPDLPIFGATLAPSPCLPVPAHHYYALCDQEIVLTCVCMVQRLRSFTVEWMSHLLTCQVQNFQCLAHSLHSRRCWFLHLDISEHPLDLSRS